MKKHWFLIALLITAAPQLSSAAVKAGERAPDFSLPDTGNRQFSLKRTIGAKNGSKGVILSFFASWCGQCRQELPLLNAATDQLNRKGITVVLVNVRESFDSINSLVADLKVNRPIVVSDRDGKVTGLYQVRVLPVTFFIGSDGRVKDVIYGGISDAAQLEKSAAKLLQ